MLNAAQYTTASVVPAKLTLTEMEVLLARTDIEVILGAASTAGSVMNRLGTAVGLIVGAREGA